jgi:hypothetical protein
MEVEMRSRYHIHTSLYMFTRSASLRLCVNTSFIMLELSIANLRKDQCQHHHNSQSRQKIHRFYFLDFQQIQTDTQD